MGEEHELTDMTPKPSDELAFQAHKMVVWKVVHPGKRGEYYLEYMRQPSSLTGSEFMNKLRPKTGKAASPMHTLFRKPVVYIATLSSVSFVLSFDS
jgi:hypothetical protein